MMATSCSTKGFIVSGSSHVSSEAAVEQLHATLRDAESQGCQAVSVGAGTGTGVAIADDCVECQKLKDKQHSYNVYVLVHCPTSVTTLSAGIESRPEKK